MVTMNSKRHKPLILLLVFSTYSQINCSKIDDYFSGDPLSEKALRFNDQEAVIQNAPTKENDLPSLSSLLSTAAADVEDRLATRAADAIGLANAAKNSQTYSTNNYGDGPDTCCNKKQEVGYNHYFKSEVDMQNTCYRGKCNLAGTLWTGRALSGEPSCDNSVVGGAFFEEVKRNMNDEGAAWQYFGAEAGVCTMFPASYPGTKYCPDDPYDPRLRPWYVQALTTNPLDVVIILDKSGSMMINDRMESSIKAVKTIISMLRPYDRFAVTPFDSSSFSQVQTGASCMDAHTLAFATGKNKYMMKKYVATIQPSGGTMYGYALNFAKTIFENSNLNVTDEHNVSRKKVLMFLSDGDPNDTGYDIMRSLKSLVESVPDLITMVYGLDIDNQILRDIANMNFASYQVENPVPMPDVGQFETITPANMKIVLGRFYANDKVNPEGLSDKAQYSMPYVDGWGMGLMVTASKAVLDDNNNLQGVVGYDITLKYLLEPLEYLITETTYAWMFTRQRGYLIYHPKFINPSAEVADINPVHYSILESDEGLVNAITPLLKQKNFTLSYTGERYIEIPREGGYTSTTRSSHQKETFFTDCQTVNPAQTDFDLVVCVTKVGDLKSTLDTNKVFTDIHPYPSTYHVPQGNQAGVCAHGFRRAYKNTGGVKFAPRQFLIPTKYMNYNETTLELERMDDLLNGAANNHANLDPTLMDMTRATNMIMTGLDTEWRDQDTKLTGLFGTSADIVIDIENADSELVPVWRYFGSMEGTFRVWPNTQLSQAFDPAQRSWFTQAIRGEPKTTFISAPYIDTFGMGYCITISRAINYNNNGQVAGVIGTDYFVSQFGESALQKTPKGQSIIVDSIGQIIYHSDFNPQNKAKFPYLNVKFQEKDKSISGAEPLTLSEITFNDKRVSDMLIGANFPTMQCHDTTLLRTKKTFDIDAFLKSKNSNEASISEFKIKRLAGTNAFVITPKNSGHQQFKVLDNPTKHNFFGQNKDYPETDYYGWPIVIRPSWAIANNNYDQCENKFSGGVQIPACQAPGPGLDDSYLGKFDKDTGFKYQNIKDLDDCFDYMNNWKEYFLYYKDNDHFGQQKHENPAAFIVPVFFVGVVIAFIICGSKQEEEEIQVAKNTTGAPTPVQNNNFAQPPPPPPPTSMYGSQPLQSAPPPPPQPVYNINIDSANINKNNN